MLNIKLKFINKNTIERCLALVLSLTMVLGIISMLNLTAVADEDFESGLGTPANPYRISTPEQLDMVRDNLSASYILIQDIDLTTYLASGGSGYAQWGDFGWKPIGDYSNKFTGNFDGGGHTINGIWINRSEEDYVGLFGFTTATIENLGINISQDKIIKGKYDVGALVGGQNYGSITNCYATGSVSGSGGSVGGLVGGIGEGIITNCYATGSVSGSGDNIGGLVGSAFTSTITNSYATGSASGLSCVGGLVGKKYRGILTGSNIITNCYATGNVYGDVESVGSLVGYQAGGGITYSYAIGNVLGSQFYGGLVGFLDYGSVTNCFFNTQTTGSMYAVGNDSFGVINVNGLTTVQMVDSNALTGVMADFGNGWTKRTSDNSYSYYPELTAFSNNGTAAQQEASKISVRVARASIANIAAPSVVSGQTLNLTVPTITSSFETITAQGWQLSENGTDTWSEYNGTAINTSYNNYYLRYYAVSNIGIIYSNNVQITVAAIDKSALISLINSAKMIKDKAFAGNGDSEYRQLSIDTFEKAIKDAETIANNITSVNQKMVNDAVSNLQSAIDTFKSQAIKKTANNPKTDDNTNLFALIAIMLISLFVLNIIIANLRKPAFEKFPR